MRELREVKKSCESLVKEKKRINRMGKRLGEKEVLRSVGKQRDLLRAVSKHVEHNFAPESGQPEKIAKSIISSMEKGKSFEKSYAHEMVNSVKESHFLNSNSSAVGVEFKGKGVEKVKNGFIHLAEPLSDSHMADLHGLLEEHLGMRLQPLKKQILFNKLLHEKL
jgi:hypothetical protein